MAGQRFVATCELPPADAADARFVTTALRVWRSAGPLLRFLCDAVDLPWEDDD